MITWDVSSLLIGEVVNVVDLRLDIFYFVTKKTKRRRKKAVCFA